MKIFQIADSSALSLPTIVESVHEYQFDNDDPVRLIPQGRIELLFQVEGRFLHRSERSNGWFERPKSFIGGLHSKAYSVKSRSGEGRCIGLRLRPELAFGLIQGNLNSLQDAVIDFVQVFGDRGKHITDEVISEYNRQERIEVVLDFIREECENITSDSRAFEIASSVSQLEKEGISGLSDRFGLSKSHFRKVFRESIGLSAKQYLKVQRVNRAISVLRSDLISSLTEIGYELNYFDQSHFIKEFASVTGMTPGQFRKTGT